jgi:hypothetical protein
MTKTMEYRVVEIALGMWEDKESFNLTDREIVDRALATFPGASVGITGGRTNEYEVNE